MGADVVDAEIENIAQTHLGGDRTFVRRVRDFVHARPGYRRKGNIGSGMRRRAPRRIFKGHPTAVLRGLGYAALEIFPHVEKAEALDPHQPFEGRTGGKIDSHCPHVDGHRAGPLDNIDIGIRAVGMGQIAECRDVGQIAVDIGDEGGGD